MPRELHFRVRMGFHGILERMLGADFTGVKGIV